MEYINESGLPPIFEAAVRAGWYEPGEPSDISCTQLIAPPQKVALERMHRKEIVQDIADALYALQGSALHLVLQRGAEAMEADVDVERRLYADMDGWRISGQYDMREGTVLWDWKTSSVWEWIHGVKPDRERQLNVLAWLCRENGIDITGLRIGFMFRDWSRSKAQYDASYPQRQIEVAEVDLWSPLEQEQYIATRVQMHQLARDNPEAFPCSDEDRWAKPAKWAVMKTGRKSALRLLDSEDEAEAYLADSAGTHIEHRPGQNIRCENYCNAAPFCQQWREINANV